VSEREKAMRSGGRGGSGILKLGVFAFMLFCLARVSAAETYLYYESPPGEFVGGGETRTLTEADGAFVLTPLAGTGIRLTIDSPIGSNWYFTLMPPDGMSLELGPYELASSLTFPGSPYADFNVSGDGRGCQSTGRVDLLYLEYDPESGRPTKLAVDFEQTCVREGSETLTGSLRVDAPPPPYPPAPDRDRDNIADRADNCPDDRNARQRDSDFDTIGDTCDPEPDRSPSFLYYDSVDDFVGQGKEILVLPAIANFHSEPIRFAFPLARDGEKINVVAIQMWSLQLWPPMGDPLIPGPYPNAWGSPSHVPRRPGLKFSGEARGCNVSRGSFDILEIEFDPEGQIERLAVDFEQECSQNGFFFSEPLVGHISLNSTGPPFAPYPDSDADDWPDTIDNCIDVPNVDQSDADLDGIGDACDPSNWQTWLDVDGTNSTYVAVGVIDRFYADQHLFDIQSDENGGVIVEAWGVPHISLKFSPSQGHELRAGPYENASYYHYFYDDRPGVNISIGSRGCSQIGGRFDVLEIEHGPDGSIERFSVNATISCFTTDVTEIALRYNAADLLFPPPLDFDGDGILDTKDNCILDSNPFQGDLDLDTIGDACDPEFNNTYLFMVGVPGNPPDLNDIELIAPKDGAFQIEKAFSSGFEYLTVSASSPGSLFRLVISPPLGKSLAVGHYEMLDYSLSHRPGDSVSLSLSYGSSTCVPGVGRFDILELALSPSGDVERLTLDFLHSCKSNGNEHHGFLRYESSAEFRDIEWTNPPPSFCVVDADNPGPDEDEDSVVDACFPVLVPEPDRQLLIVAALLATWVAARLRTNRQP
jgi:hypothetical protein